MNKDFYESSCGPENERLQRVVYTIYNLLFILMIIASCVMLYCFLLFGDSGFVLFLVFFALSGVALYFVKGKLSNYYDYTFISGEVRIVKVINGKRRKKAIFFKCSDISVLGNIESETFAKFYYNKEYKRYILTPNGLNAKGQLYYVACNSDQGRALVVMQCNEQFINYVVSYSGIKILDKDFAKEN